MKKLPLKKFIVFWKRAQFDLLPRLARYLAHFPNLKLKTNKKTHLEKTCLYLSKYFIYFGMDADQA